MKLESFKKFLLLATFMSMLCGLFLYRSVISRGNYDPDNVSTNIKNPEVQIIEKGAEKSIENGENEDHILKMYEQDKIPVLTTTNRSITTATAKSSLPVKKRKIIIILAYYRSGSTFFGQLFNKNPEAFYLFEPLYTYSDCNLGLTEERIEFLKKLSICDFNEIPQIHKNLHNITHYDDQYARCIEHNVCFMEHIDGLIDRYRTVLENAPGKNGTFPDANQLHEECRRAIKEAKHFSDNTDFNKALNTTIESALCKESKITAFKLLRTCATDGVEKLYKELKSLGYDTYVIHIIRDVRASLLSGSKLIWNKDDIEMRSMYSCNHIRDKIIFKQVKTNEIMMDGRLLEVRHEDLSMNTTEEAERVYSFIGEDMHPNVHDWISENTAESMQYLNKQFEKASTILERKKWQAKIYNLKEKMNWAYGTVRIPSVVLNKWRKEMELEQVLAIQSQCEDVLMHYGYKLINNDDELRNTTYKVW